MEKFESFEAYNQIVKQAQIDGLRNINCFLMPDEIRNLITKAEIFYLNDCDTLQIVVEKDRYVKVFWFGTENFKFLNVQTEKPILTDIPFSNIMSEKNLALKKKLESFGFKVNSTSTRSCSKNLDVLVSEYEGYYIERLNRDEIDAIYEIWEENFDCLENLLYSKKEIEECENPIYVLKDKHGNIVGGMELIINQNSGLVQRIAISKGQQGKGLGSILEKFYINMCKELGVRTLLLYTVDGNLNAQRFHSKFGFVPDGRKNCQLIYKEGRNG